MQTSLAAVVRSLISHMAETKVNFTRIGRMTPIGIKERIAINQTAIYVYIAAKIFLKIFITKRHQNIYIF